MSAILNFQEQDVRMPFVRFEQVAMENKAASLELGHYVAVDVDMAYVTPPYSKDIMKYKVKQWLDQLEVDCQNQRIPREWVEQYKKQYAYWKEGRELPLNGIPIKGWGVISPAQQETLIKMHVLTVEQLAVITEEGIRRLGMGGVDLKNKAEAWLKSLKKSGAITMELSELKAENARLKANQSVMESKIDELTRLVSAQSSITAQSTPLSIDSIDELI